jgi:transaldolase
MKFFIDTANIDEIREAKSWGLVDGVTTNPSLIAQTGRPFQEVVHSIVEIADGPISVEVTALDVDGMIKEGRTYAKISENIAVKVPLNLDGLKVCRALTNEGIDCNVTLCFSATQALLAAKAGARYISPFVGRLDDYAQVGMGLIADIVEIYNNYDFNTEVLVASIRSPIHVLEAARMGADICTIPFKVIGQLVKHPLTDIGMEKFLADWKNVPK